jgi:hypothetical protein
MIFLFFKLEISMTISLINLAFKLSLGLFDVRKYSRKKINDFSKKIFFKIIFNSFFFY